MLSKEKHKLLDFFHCGDRWCQDAEARDASGNPVKFHDPLATAWDITGALCCLFGWKRASTLFGQLERHIQNRKRVFGFNQDAAIESMVTLQAYNDRPDIAFQNILVLLQTMPVWPGVSRIIGRTVTSVRVGREEWRGLTKGKKRQTR